MKPYWTVFSARFRALLQYRAAAMAGAWTNFFFGVIRMMIFWGFYASTNAPQPMSYPDTVTYIWLGQATFLLIMFRVEGDIASMIRSGAIVYELARPVDLYNLWFSRTVATKVAPTLLRCAPVLLFAGLFCGFKAPHSVAGGALFGCSIVVAVLLSSAIATLITISLFWTMASHGINRLFLGLAYVFSGIVIPLPLFPDWMQPMLNFMPFRGLMDTPFRIYMGHMPTSQALSAMSHQIIWTVAFIALGRVLLSVGQKRLVVQGG
ncbi:ABC transporter permease [Candidatus Hydrogenedentota bacterium]